MRKLDIILQKWRHAVAIPFVPQGSDVLDIGGFDGSFLMRVYDKIRSGVCIDPYLTQNRNDKITFIRARIDSVLPLPDDSFDVITLFAVFEHLGRHREVIALESFRVCRNKGLVLLTVPSSAVDVILKVLKKVRLIDGMSLEEHQHFKASETVKIFEGVGFTLKRWSRFQMGLNNLFIFQKIH
jgi:ubiquinone/menaquinone biosynthesis C-methylase UbiE